MARDLAERVGQHLAHVDVPGRHSVEAGVDEVTVIVADVPFRAHGMEFTRAFQYHFTLRLGPDGTLTAYWGMLAWEGDGVEGGPSKIEKGSAAPDDVDAALAWLTDAIAKHAK